MIGGQGEDSCGKSGTDETPQERKRRGGSPSARGKRSLARKSTAVSQAVQLAHASHLFVFRLDSFCYVSASFIHAPFLNSGRMRRNVVF
ncbi:hypothetical protein [Priestia megaterium]|uniref:hypothetical protein n=1 Tax=Priestia megaterium TaxID=1404 RepID=UPI0004BACB1B|nr:hypothetical protein [Priestia megaterium]MCM3018818.1 hypothetical protein [Priestia megaterium]MCM3181811.1 hypothetical protein [Priestia megaterium]MED3915199.1 hypothetical protein [Priestia megaterium]